jgi:anthranilate synthase component I
MLNIQPASFAEFQHEAERGNVVPVVRSLPADMPSPVEAFRRVARGARYAFLLESIEGGEHLTRFSFLGAEPWMVARGRGEEILIERGGTVETRAVRATDFLREYFRANKFASREGLPPLAGGAVGYLSYDAARWFEPALGQRTGGGAEWDDAVWMFYRKVVAYDHARQRIFITAVVDTQDAGASLSRLRELYESAVAETDRVEKALREHVPPPRPCRQQTPLGAAEFVANWTKEGFEQAVRSVKERIAAGDCYQVVLSQRFAKRAAATPLDVYRALRSVNPSPYMYFLRLGDKAIIGASPEMLVRCRGRHLDHRPIAGTRRRGATEIEDLRLGAEMRGDEKEVAEHMMLVDLGRNDLGRVAEYGSVTVEELMSIERYSHVQHLVTKLSARLRSGLDRFDALAACFPAGTVTGAPKVRAMQVIRELEPDNRGVYAGAVLYADYVDNLDSCIAIRTILMRGDNVSIQAGAGIVADSVPEREYEETLKKAGALFAAIELAERGL